MRFSRICALTALLLPACATIPPANLRAKPEQPAQPRVNRASPELMIAVAFSGGGTRAAALAYGVLEELAATIVEVGGESRRLLDEVDLITSVSGGSFTAAYFGLHGDGIFESFGEAVLYRDMEGALFRELLKPTNWPRLASGRYGRGELAARYYDRVIFDDATLGDFKAGGPRIILNSTDLTSGQRFSFVPEFFDALCSDLPSYPVSRAVTASSAVPGVFTPITLENFSRECERPEPAWIGRTLSAEQGTITGESEWARNFGSYYRGDPRRYVHLVDGGIAGNLGIRLVFLREAEFGDVTSRTRLGSSDARRFLFILVNAETWVDPRTDAKPESPSAIDSLNITSTILVNRQNRDSVDLLRSATKRWKAEFAGQGRDVDFHLTEINFRNLAQTEAQYFEAVPTAMSLEREQVDRIREAGRRLLREHPSFRSFLAGLAGVQED